MGAPATQPGEIVMAEHIIVSDEGATRTIVMRRPDKKNALTPEMFLAMSEAINSAQHNPDIRSLILTGRSGVFTAGDDVGDFVKEAATKREEARPRNSVAFVRSLITNRKPIIAAVDGIAVGMGVTMVLHCDYVIAGTTSSFVSPFIQYGLVPEGASSLLLPRMAGHQHAFSLLIMGRPMSALDARDAGFVNSVVPPGHAIIEAQKVAREINELPPEAVAISRKLLKLPTEDLLRRMEEEEHLFSERIHAPTVVAAVNGFMQRKKR
jgi:enoyl-CoA hydratase/carnithine racemase